MDPIIKGMIIALLKQKKSNYVIIKEMKEHKVTVWPSYLTRLRKELSGEIVKKAVRKKTGPKEKLTKRQQHSLRLKLLKENPPTDAELAKHFKVSRSLIWKYKFKKFGLKKRSKRRVHALTERTKRQRHLRSWPLYLAMRKDKWQKFITSDEKKFVLATANNKTKIYYTDPKFSRTQPALERSPQGDKGLMVWASVWFNGRSNLHFVKPKVKIDSDYYINNILKPFFEKDLPSKVQESQLKKLVFHQDSAPSHRAKKTLKWFADKKISFIHPIKWLANSPDAAPLDYCIWRQLFLRKRNPTTLIALKKCLNSEWSKFPQEIINNALKGWPRRLRYIYYAKGSHIEHVL